MNPLLVQLLEETNNTLLIALGALMAERQRTAQVELALATLVARYGQRVALPGDEVMMTRQEVHLLTIDVELDGLVVRLMPRG